MPSLFRQQTLIPMEQQAHPFILASQSPYRKQLLSKLIKTFTCHPAKIDESRQANESVAEMVERLSIQKAQVIASHHPDSWIIASDQSAALDDEVLGKPHTHTQALAQLQKQQGKTLTYHTGICLYNPITKSYHYAEEPTKVVFRQLTTERLNDYLLAEQPYDCAGSFKSEGLGIMLFSAIYSQDPNALIGLPLIKLCELFEQAGLSLPLTE